MLDLVVASFTGERLFFPGISGHPNKFGEGFYLKLTTTDPSEDPFHYTGQDGLWVSGDVGDLDGDGIKDIVIGTKLYVIVGSAAEPKLDLRYTFESPDSVWDPSPSIGDLNGDGKPDVVITYQSDSKSDDTYVYWNNSTPGSYSFDKEPIYHWDSKLVTSSRVSLGDLNGDGLLDLAGPAGIYFNTGSATTPDFAFGEPVAWTKTGGPDWTATNDQPGHVFLKDADGDGLLDAYVSNLSSTVWQVLFYKNIGSASSHDLQYVRPVVAASSPLDLAERGKTAPDSYPYQSFLAHGDVDQNGREDVLIGLAEEKPTGHRRSYGIFLSKVAPPVNRCHTKTAIPGLRWNAWAIPAVGRMTPSAIPRTCSQPGRIWQVTVCRTACEPTSGRIRRDRTNYTFGREVGRCHSP